MIKGASRNLKDHIGRTAIELIDENIAPFLHNELVSILGPQPWQPPCSQTKTPLLKVQKNFKTFAIYVFLVLSTFVQLHLFVFPTPTFAPWVLQLNIHFLIVNVFFFLASFRDPGRVTKRPEL